MDVQQIFNELKLSGKNSIVIDGIDLYPVIIIRESIRMEYLVDKKGNKYGLYKCFYDDILIQEDNYIHGLKHGFSTTWSINGELICKMYHK